MINRGFPCLLAMLALCGCLQTARAAEPCALKRVAELQTDTSHGSLLVKVQIDGHDANLLVDTGSPFNMITRQMADQLKLALLPLAKGVAVDASAHAFTHMVHTHELKIGALSAPDIPFIVMDEAIGEAPPYDGVFSANFLEAYDVELDLGHDKMSLYLPNRCPAAPVYWTSDFDVVPFRIDGAMHAILNVKLEGQNMRAMLDTGSSATSVSAQAARRLVNFDPEATNMKPDGMVHAGTGAALPYYRHRFDTFEIAGTTFHHTEFLVIPQKLDHSVEYARTNDHPDSDEIMQTQVILGLSHLKKLRAYLAFNAQKIYFSPANAQ